MITLSGKIPVTCLVDRQEIVVGIIALVGFIGGIAAWIAKLSGTLTMLETTLKMLNETLKEMKESSKNTHKELFAKIEEQRKRITDHEGRLLVLEEKNRDCGN